MPQSGNLGQPPQSARPEKSAAVCFRIPNSSGILPIRPFVTPLSRTMALPLTIVIADDSALYRQMLLNVLRRIEGVEVVGVATNGGETVEKVRTLRPDVVTLDVHMPVMDGIAVLKELRKFGCQSRVIMVSSLTGAGDPATVAALMEGAFDHVLKPVGLEPHLARESIRKALAEKLEQVRAAAQSAVVPGVGSTAQAAAAGPAQADLPYDAVAIGTSTGGPEALRSLIPRLPRGMPFPVFVVQHMPATFTPTLAARLNELSAATVVEADAGMMAEAGGVYIAPGGRHLRLERRGRGVVCTTDDAAPRLGCRPSFDNLLESAVGIYGKRMLAVVLTGMGCDGLDGCRRVKAAGGTVIAQSREGCTVYGMPKAVVDQRLTDAVLPLEAIANAICMGLHGSAQSSSSAMPSSTR
jgi:two-component system chemotaxis response regulator CheB